MGLLDFFGGGGTPSRQIADYDDNTKQLMDKGFKRAIGGPDNSASEQINPTGQAAYQSFGGGQGLMGDQVAGAIKEKYGRTLTNDLNNLTQSTNLNTRTNQIQNIQKAQQALIAQQQVQNDVFSAQMEAHNMQEAARAQAIGSILGMAGSIGGYAAAGGFSSKPGVTIGKATHPMGAADSFDQSSGTSVAQTNPAYSRAQRLTGGMA